MWFAEAAETRRAEVAAESGSGCALFLTSAFLALVLVSGLAGLASEAVAVEGGVSLPAVPATVETTGYANVDWSSRAFSAMMWLAGLGVGFAAFGLFLFLNRKLRSALDWILPLLLVAFLGYVIVLGPTWVSDEVYENWSAQCLNSDAAPANRTPAEDSTDAACQRAQVGHHALGYHLLVSAYRNHVLNGSEEMLMPGELKRLAWLLLFVWAAVIYGILLTIRNRFFAH